MNLLDDIRVVQIAHSRPRAVGVGQALPLKLSRSGAVQNHNVSAGQAFEQTCHDWACYVTDTPF